MSRPGRAAPAPNQTRKANGRTPGKAGAATPAGAGAAPNTAKSPQAKAAKAAATPAAGAGRAKPPAAVVPQPSEAPGRARWIVPGTLAASLAGLGVSIYLTIAHYTTTALLACPENATIDCRKVTTSPESVILGVPVAVLGLVYFAAMLVLNSPRAWRATDPRLRAGRLAAAVAGLGFVFYLIYVELFEVDAICLWCTSVHAINLVLFALIALGTAATSGSGGAAAAAA